ncbi:GDSL-type esterase/lipase family protein [Caulobacter sp. DWR3-1-2]|uniref:GDSL-type esterase/lipase family protein n=1 Tax=Caulobacter sp. DWR3-1-2 TaxID=2804647 RepID=UPI003CF45EDA
MIAARIKAAVLAALGVLLLCAQPALAQVDPVARGLAVQAKTDLSATMKADAAQIAQRILRAANNGRIPTVAAVQPTVTVGTAGAVSTINGNSATSHTHFANNTSVLTAFGTNAFVTRFSAYTGNHVSNQGSSDTARAGSQGYGHIIGFDGQDFDVAAYGTGGGGGFFLIWTDLNTGVRQTMSVDTTLNGTNSYIKVDFGSRAPRIVETYFGDAVLVRGYNFRVTDTLWKADRAENPKLLLIGDSWTRGNTSGNLKTGVSDIIVERLGSPGALINGVGGTGYVAVGTPTQRSFIQRLNNGDFDQATIGLVDLIFVWGSINDAPSSDAAVTTAATTFLTALAAKQPNAIIIVAPPQFTAVVQTPAARYTAVRNGYLAAVAAMPRPGKWAYIDSSPAGEAWNTGIGRQTAPVGTGNNDVNLGSDGQHLNAVGNITEGNMIANSIIRQLRIIAGQ